MQASSSAEAAPTQQRHAFLHDFCLCIPYGAIIAACGLLMRLFGGGQTAVLITGAGVLQIALSTLSLKTWRARQPVAKLFTLLEAGARKLGGPGHVLCFLASLAAAQEAQRRSEELPLVRSQYAATASPCPN